VRGLYNKYMLICLRHVIGLSLKYVIGRLCMHTSIWGVYVARLYFCEPGVAAGLFIVGPSKFPKGQFCKPSPDVSAVKSLLFTTAQRLKCKRIALTTLHCL